MKIWISKYALTEGLIEKEAVDVGDSMMQVGTMQYLFGEGREWHRTRESAAARAEVMRKAKIVSMRKQLARLEAMRFDV